MLRWILLALYLIASSFPSPQTQQRKEWAPVGINPPPLPTSTTDAGAGYDPNGSTTHAGAGYDPDGTPK